MGMLARTVVACPALCPPAALPGRACSPGRPAPPPHAAPVGSEPTSRPRRAAERSPGGSSPAHARPSIVMTSVSVGSS